MLLNNFVLENKALKRFREVILSTAMNKRTAAYFGIAEVYVNHLCLDSKFCNPDEFKITEFKYRVDKFLDNIGELIIIDRDELYRCIEKSWRYRVEIANLNKNGNRQKLIGVYNSFYEYLGIMDIYSPSDILEINNNFSIFRDAIDATNKLLPQLEQGN